MNTSMPDDLVTALARAMMAGTSVLELCERAYTAGRRAIGPQRRCTAASWGRDDIVALCGNPMPCGDHVSPPATREVERIGWPEDCGGKDCSGCSMHGASRPELHP